MSDLAFTKINISCTADFRGKVELRSPYTLQSTAQVKSYVYTQVILKLLYIYINYLRICLHTI